MSCFVGKTATLCALQCNRRAVGIVHAKLFAVAVAKIELVQIAMQMGFAQSFAAAAHRGGCANGCHDLADAVHEEPSGLHAAIEGRAEFGGC